MAKFRAVFAVLPVVVPSACASLPPQAGRVETQAVAPADSMRLGAAFTPQERKHRDQTAFYLLPDGLDALLSRSALADAADRTLDLQYYISS